MAEKKTNLNETLLNTNRKRSSIWLHFSIVSNEHARCDICKKILSYKSGNSSNLKKHLTCKHPLVLIPEKTAHNPSNSLSTTSSTITQKQEEESLSSTSASKAPTNTKKRTQTTLSTYITHPITIIRQSLNKKPSPIWLHFSVVSNGKAMCYICKKNLSYKAGNTSNLKKHLTCKHPLVLIPEKTAQNPSNSQKQEEESLSTTSASKVPTNTKKRTQTTLSTSITHPITIVRQKMINDLLINMIIRDLQPFSIVEDVGFTALMNYLEPSFELPTSTTLSKTHLPQKYLETVAKVQGLLSRVTRINITTDSWTSSANDNYLGVTGHFIDEDWQQKSVLLESIIFNEKHTAINLSQEFNRITKKWDIREKIFCVTTDNSADIVAAIKLCNWRHVSCFAHSLNLIARTGLNVIIIKDVITKVKKIVEYFHRSTTANAKFLETQRQLNNNSIALKLKNEVATRWNSTFYMLERCIKVKESLAATIEVLNIPVSQLSENEWSIVEKTVNLLIPLEQITIEISAEKNVCVSKIIPLVNGLQNFLETNHSSDECIEEVRIGLLKSVKIHFADIESDEVFSVAAFLDPRFKRKAFSNEASYNKAKENVEKLLKLSFIEFIEQPEMYSSQSIYQEENMNYSCTATDIIWKDFDSDICEQNNATNSETILLLELKQFIEEPNIPRKENPLAWWKLRALLYPNLSKIAIKYLGVLGTSVSCERIFSKSGQIVSERRSKLKPKPSNVNMLVFLNHNYNI